MSRNSLLYFKAKRLVLLVCKLGTGRTLYLWIPYLLFRLSMDRAGGGSYPLAQLQGLVKIYLLLFLLQACSNVQAAFQQLNTLKGLGGYVQGVWGSRVS